MVFAPTYMLQRVHCCLSNATDEDPGVEGAGVQTFYDLANNCAVITKVTTVDDNGVPTFTYYDEGGATVPNSTSFSPSKPSILGETKFATDTVTGAFQELTVLVDATNNAVSYLDATGAPYVPGANEIVRDYVEEVALGNEIINITPGTPATLTVPAEARYAYMNVNGADAMYAHGAAPVAAVDHRVNDGGRIEINSADRLATFQLDSLDGATPFATRVYYYNRDPEVGRT